MAQKQNRSYLWIVALLLGFAFIIVVGFSSLPVEGCVGIVEVKGPIIYDDIEPSLLFDEIKGAKTIAQEIRSGQDRPDVRAILVLIDSPGGSVIASKEIYDALVAVNKTKVAHINEIGTSGAYFVAVGADYIVADPNSITGSIGARMTLPDFSKLFEKIGYNETTIKTGAMKDIGNPARPLTEAEYNVLYGILNESYSDFVDAIIKARQGRLNMPLFEKILDARIVSGRQAKEVGLVDELGKKEDALKKAAELAGMKGEPRECSLSKTAKRKGFFGSLVSQIEYRVKNNLVPRLLYQP
ncbi:MAG: signal peptide peptidase SppA [Candidatus Micrarchaeota archaeon]|nr:signal peptide peptidase SppA [Candidatus Micrarchaeota archaeon]